MVNHPGQAMTINEIPGIIAQAFALAAISSNIVVSMKTRGICSLFETFLKSTILQDPLSKTDKYLLLLIQIMC